MALSALQHPHPRNAEIQRSIRVEDYLNDKLQTTADLANIDSLLRDAREQQSLLEQQLQEARVTFRTATSASKDFNHKLHIRAQDFQRRQADIDRRLKIVSQSETSDDAVQKFSSSIESLQKLDVARKYMSLLTEVECLSNEARANFKRSPQEALKPYLRLKELATALREAQPAAEDAAPHLVDHVDRVSRVIWRQMKDSFARDFEATLKEMKWPGNDVTLDGSLQQEWTSGVKTLLELQEPELKSIDNNQTSSEVDLPVLLPLEVMMKPLELRFKYHFEGNRPTNKLDKPEYFLSHVIGLLNTYDEFFATYFQPVLRQHFKSSSLSLTSIYIDSTSALITAMLPMLRRKISAILPQISDQAQLFSHLIHELMSFDTSLRDEWSYDGGNSIDGWRGLIWEVLVKSAWFPRWLSVEKNFALTRYETIIGSPETFEIDRDSDNSICTKPTHAAIRVNDLLEAVTDRYRPLQDFSQRIQFLIDIQITIFDMFHNRLRDSLSAYQSLTSSIGRNLQGAPRETQAELKGLGGLDRLCRIYGSAEYLERKMRDWSDDVFFIELWDELQHRARRDNGEKNFAGPMTAEHVAERTSTTMGSDEDRGALFDETANAYRRLRIKTEDVIQDRLISSLRESLRPYGRINPWSSLSSSDSSSSLTLTAELDSAVQYLDENLAFLANVFSKASLRRMGRQITLAVQSVLLDKVLMRYSFSTAGIAQFKRDVEAIWSTIDKWLGEMQAEKGMRRVCEALILLELPVEAGNGDEDDESGTGLGLWEVEKRIFQNNESARETLDELGIEVLSGSDARDILSQRVELRSA